MATDLETFRRLAPDLSTLSDHDALEFVADAVADLDPTLYGVAWQRAAVLYGAHMAASRPTSSSSAAAGALTSQRDGRAARSYAVSKAASSDDAWRAWLSTTAHGRAFLAIHDRATAGPFGVRMPAE